MSSYTVTMRDGQVHKLQADNIHTSPQGHIKLLNGKGHAAALVAFFNAEDVKAVVRDAE